MKIQKVSIFLFPKNSPKNGQIFQLLPYIQRAATSVSQS